MHIHTTTYVNGVHNDTVTLLLQKTYKIRKRIKKERELEVCLPASRFMKFLQYQMYMRVSDSKVAKNRTFLWIISVVLINDVTWLMTFGERRAKSTKSVWNFNLRSSQAQLSFHFFFFVFTSTKRWFRNFYLPRFNSVAKKIFFDRKGNGEQPPS